MTNHGTKNPNHRLTLRISEDAVRVSEEAVRLGLAPSINAFVEDAIRARSREVRNARLQVLAAEAMNDPDFVSDMRETMAAFEPAQKDGWPAEGQDRGMWIADKAA